MTHSERQDAIDPGADLAGSLFLVDRIIELEDEKKELLAALQALQALVAQRSGHSTASMLMQKAYTVARAAIAKAEGGVE
jgi:hypothetical protein